MNSIFCFLSSRPPGGIPQVAWDSFRSEILGLLMVTIFVSAALIVGLYAWQTRKMTIRQPKDPFTLLSIGYWLGWVAISLFPGFGMGALYMLKFSRSFPGAKSAVPCAFGLFISTSLCILVLFQIAIWFKGITPAKFLYHPRWPWRLLARRSR